MISLIMKEMIKNADGNIKDINHFLKVYCFAKMIGEQEHLDQEIQYILEVTAIVHDIACPLCRKKYGNSQGHYQEIEGPTLVHQFLEPFHLKQSFIDRVAYIVGHHHTYQNIDGLDYQILIEADFLVNADEGHVSKEAIEKMKNNIFSTITGIQLLESIYY